MPERNVRDDLYRPGMTSYRVILVFPDGSERELLPDTPGILVYKVEGDRMPRFQIDGQWFTVDLTNEVPEDLEIPGGATRFLSLVALEPPLN